MSEEDRKRKRQKRNEDIAWQPEDKSQKSCAVLAIIGLALIGVAEAATQAFL